jgi:deoxyribose-phosphate aldolase
VDREALVEQITREVLAALGAAPSKSVPTAAGGNGTSDPRRSSSPGADLVIFDGTAEDLRCLVEQGNLAPSRATLALPRDSEVKRSDAERHGFSRVVYMDEGQRAVDLVSGTTRVLLPVYHYQQLANLAGLCDSCWDVRLTLKALADGHPVILTTASLQTPSPFAAKIEAYLQEIAGYGIQVVRREGSRPSSTSMSPPPARTLMRPDPATGPTALPLPKPSSAARSEATGSPCALKSVGECGGLGHCTRHLPERVGIILEQGADRISAAPGSGPLGGHVARYIDHTLLKPDATREQVLELCGEAREHGFASVCINPAFVHLAADALRGSEVKVCTVIGFPLGANTTVTKALETRDAVANGADEIDMVINVGALKARNDDLVRRDIEAVVAAADGRIVKVILETALLNDEEKVRACHLSREAGADFVKTSTGFGPGGATAHDIALMRQTVGRYMGVKASGGIRDLAGAQEMLAAGATRIGASASVKIVHGEAPTPAGKSQY